MKNTIFFILGIIFGTALFGYEVKMRVIDDHHQPVPGAEVTIDFIGIKQGSGQAYRGRTDNEGEFQATGKAMNSVFLVADKPGYYEARVGSLPNNQDINYTIVLPQILNPIPLFVNRFNPGSGRGLKVPIQNTWLGYDFESADWVAPYGKGRNEDIRFKFKNEFIGWKENEERLARSRQINRQLSEAEFKNFYGKWDAELEISFPGDKEGMHEESHFLSYSRLKLPHLAPEDGYVPNWHYTATSCRPPTTRDDIGFFLRTRVKLDQEGNIVSANYAKLRGDVYLVPNGTLMFWYYFNPTPNDRNLEFDPKHNLFPASFPGSNVGDP